MLKSLNFEPGKIIFDEFNITTDLPLDKQIDLLKEDLFQVDFFDKYILDIGWYPEFSAKGQFVICLVKDFDWEKPIARECCRDLEKLVTMVREMVDYLKMLSS